MTTDLIAMRRGNYDKFIETIPPEVKKLTQKIFSFFKENPSPYNFVLAEGTAFIYLMDDDFETTGAIVGYVGADYDSPPFKPYKNTEEDEVFGLYDVFLKINLEIMQNSGYLDEPVEVEKEQVVTLEAEATEEVSRDMIDADAIDSAVAVDAGSDELSEPVDELSEPDDQLYFDNMKLIARDVEAEALDLMKRVHNSIGMIVPLTIVRIGAKLMIRTNQDQSSFDQHFEVIREFAEQIFKDATSVTGTKNNVQVLF